ncbi:MAG: low affinity iron permease family protein [Solirubrobacteraceae bacterium]
MPKVKHPADITEARSRGNFEEFAERTSYLASSRIFFALCFAIVLAWALGLALGASDRFLTGISGGISALTLVLVALLKNAEMRSERAIQRKLDAIASALLEQTRGEEQDAEGELEHAIRLHEEI